MEARYYPGRLLLLTLDGERRSCTEAHGGSSFGDSVRVAIETGLLAEEDGGTFETAGEDDGASWTCALDQQGLGTASLAAAER